MKNFNYLKEKARMLKSIGGGAEYNKNCHGECADCALSFHHNQYSEGCIVFEIRHPEEAEAAVRKWAEEHPRKTRKNFLLEHFPEVRCFCGSATPLVCAYSLGLMSREEYEENCPGGDCEECWNTEWAEDRPIHTRLDYLLERFPDTEMHTDPGDTVDLKYPQVCAKALGIDGVNCDDHINCYDCWHTAL